MMKQVCRLAVALALFALFTIPLASAQNGQPIISTGTPDPANTNASPAYIDAYVASGGSGSTNDDVCLRIQSIYTSTTLIPAGGSAVVDARGFTNTNYPSGYTSWACSVNPFATSATNNSSAVLTGKTGRLLLGWIDIPATVSWVPPSHMVIEGIGNNGTGSNSTTPQPNTIIHAASGFSAWMGQGSVAEPALIQFGVGGNATTHGQVTFGIQVRNLTLDCLGVSGCIGIFNNNSQEGSLVDNVQIFNAPAVGLRVTTNNPYSINGAASAFGAVNSGPYRNVFINFNSNCGTCNANTVALQVDGATTTSTTGEGRSIRGFDNFTVSGNNLSTLPDTLVSIYGTSTTFTNSHVEYCSGSTSYGCIEIGANSSYVTYGVRVADVTVGNNSGGFDILIDNVSTVGNVLVENLNHESINSNTIKDLVTGNTVGDNYVGWYFLGSGSTPAVYTSSTSLTNSGTPYNLYVNGSFKATSKSFQIDHPLDPEHEYLYHSVVESPDMMNIYNGTIVTDKHGLATVTLPDYFEALNRDFRYQLTPVGQFAQAMVAEKIKGNRFVLKTSKPGVEVSWQVTGVRHDRYAIEHPMHVEEAKPESQHNR